MALLERFGPLIARIRVARDLSQEKLAHLSGLHATTISEVERGKTDVVLSTIEALGRGLGIEPGSLFTMAGSDEPQPAAEPGRKTRSTDYGARPRQLRFSIVAERTSSGYAAYCPDVPGAAATGASREEVERSMREAITAELHILRRAGSPIPEPASFATVITITL
jgi:predicted RNase H-like HicB family nuclease/DNA-binding XRE family transcriptional regulator